MQVDLRWEEVQSIAFSSHKEDVKEYMDVSEAGVHVCKIFFLVDIERIWSRNKPS
jgi:hypothetical protein